MAKLSEKEQALLEKLNKKAEAPDAPAVSKSISANIDLSDEKQVALAVKHGFLTEEEVEELEEEASNGKKDGKRDATPRRRGYFNTKEDEEE